MNIFLTNWGRCWWASSRGYRTEVPRNRGIYLEDTSFQLSRGDCAGEFRTTIGRKNHVLVAQRSFWKWSQYIDLQSLGAKAAESR